MNEDLLIERVQKTPKDAYVESCLELILTSKGKELSYEDGVLRQKGRIYVPDNGTLRGDMIAAYHDHPLHGHLGEKKMQKLVNQVFHWKNSGKNIHQYVQSCHPCMQAKVQRRKPYGNLKPLPIGQ